MVIYYNVTLGSGTGSAALLTGGTNSRRYGIAFLTGSAAIGKAIKTWTVNIKRTGSPVGNITCNVYDGSTNVVATATEVVDASTLPTTFTNYSWNFTSPRTIVANDRLTIDYDGTTRVDIEIYVTDQYDGALTLRTRWNGTAWVNGGTEDVAGIITNGVFVTGSYTHKYDIRNYVVQSYTHIYNLKNLATKTFTHIYNMRQLATKTYTHIWNMRQLATKTYTHIYNIKTLVAKTYTHIYNMAGIVSQTFTHIYNARQLATKTYTHIWNMRQLATKSYTHIFNIRNLATKTFTHKYSILKIVAKTYTHIYYILPTLTQVSQTFTHKYRMFQLAGKTFTHKYNSRQLARATFSHLYSIVNIVTGTYQYPAFLLRGRRGEEDPDLNHNVEDSRLRAEGIKQSLRRRLRGVSGRYKNG